MKRSSPSRAVLPAGWPEILQRVQQTLEQADAAAAQRAAALEPTNDPPREPAWREGLDQLRTRLDSLTTYADRAAGLISDADVALGAGEDMLRSWLQASEAARRKLATWVNGAVG